MRRPWGTVTGEPLTRVSERKKGSEGRRRRKKVKGLGRLELVTVELAEPAGAARTLILAPKYDPASAKCLL